MDLCLACGNRQNGPKTCLRCAASVLVPTEAPPRAPRGYRLESAAEPGRYLSARSPLGAVMGYRVKLGALVLVAGEPGSGKSTLALELAVELEPEPLFVDGEMGAELAAATQARVFASDARRVVPESAEGALEAIADLGRLAVVLDSLHEICPRIEEQPRYVKTLARLAAARALVVLLVCHKSKGHNVSGQLGIEHNADAVLVVGEKDVRQVKCRWAPRQSLPRPQAA